ncbi:MAG: TM0106 family RecB-like putative nuclease [Actinomycetota bacterium]
MILNASEFYSYYRPSPCELRVFLRQNAPEEEMPLGPFEELLKRLGIDHEKEHLQALLTSYEMTDLSEGDMGERVEKTKAAITQGSQFIYHGLFLASTVINGARVEIIGEPDFILRGGSGYIVRDAKLSKRINEKEHPEIFRQMELYGWLFEQVIGTPPERLEIYGGSKELTPIGYDGGRNAFAELGEIIRFRTCGQEPYCPVGWSKCNSCGFFSYCWGQAELRKDLALVFQVDQNLARALHDIGICTIEELLDNFDEARLSCFERPWGAKTQKVGKKAGQIILMAQAMAENQEIVMAKAELPSHDNFVMFDVESVPPQIEDIEKVYLWGLKVYGENPSGYLASPAEVGEDGDRKCWLGFLDSAKSIFENYGSIPFVHWSSYEKTCVKRYIDRYGDGGGIGTRVLDNLLDLLPLVRSSVALPVPSYSLKVVEQYVGFCRSQSEYGGEWSMAKYIEAVETEDEQERESLLDEIIQYNREDLDATWAVLEWYKNRMCEL